MSRIPHKSSTASLKSPIREKTIVNKKPFSRPFSKSRLDNNPTTPRMSSPPPTETTSLLRQNQELRQRLQDEANSYRRRIDTYKQAQQNQATLVSRLQSKVLQYKQRCNDLEGRIHDIKPVAAYQVEKASTGPCLPPTIHSHAASSLPCTTATIDGHHGDYGHHSEHADLCHSLDDEKHRYEQLLSQNNMLRQQLEESNRTNMALTNDLQKLTNDWANLRDELLVKEDEFKEEEQAFNDYYNNEHNRLLKMWREVVAVKRSFKDMQTAMKAELDQMRVDVTGVNRELQSACNGVVFTLNQASKADAAQHLNTERETSDLKTKIASLKAQYESARHEISQRDLRVQELMQQTKSLEERCSAAEAQAILANRLSDEIDRLNSALRDIAHAVLQDAEVSTDSDTSAAIQHLHLSQSAVPPRSPRRDLCKAVRTSQAFAEGTISAVQAALHKYQLCLHDFQVKMQSNSDIIQTTKKQLESSENTKDLLTTKLAQLTEKLDASNSQLAELFKERGSLQKTLENVRNEKQNSERGRADLNNIIDNLSLDYEKLQNTNGKLQKHADILEEDKKALELEIQRILKDKDITEMNLRAEEERSSRLREETITLREELNKLYLARDLLEQQRLESDNIISLLEKQKAEYEFELDRTSMENANLQNRMERFSSTYDTASGELKTMKDNLIETENERNKLRCHVNDQAADIASLKKELISAEQVRLELESARMSLNEKQKCMEMEKDKIEQELAHVTRDRGDIHNQLTAVSRKKEAIGEELIRTRQKLEQTNETNNRLNRSLEDLVKENEERQVIIEGSEKELQRLQEIIASLRSEKESLEGVLFDTNTTLEGTEEKKSQLERDYQDLRVKEESLKNQINQLKNELESCNRRAQEMKTQLVNAARAQEADFLQKISQLTSGNDENIRKLNEEKEFVRISLEKRMQQALQALQASKDEEIAKLRDRVESLENHLESLCQQHKETMIRTENEKQQSLLIAHQDKQSILEKLEAVVRELKAETENSERIRREGSAKIEKDRNLIAYLRDEIAKLKMKGEELKTQLEEEISKLVIQQSSLKEEYDAACRLIDELKMEIRLREDRAESLNNQLQDISRKLKEVESSCDAVRKELTDTRRTLGDSNIERDKYANSNKELRDHIKHVESSKRELSRTVEEALQKIASLEETRNCLENEKTRLTTLLKEAENNLAKTSYDLGITKNCLHKLQLDSTQKESSEKELQSRLCNEIEERERIQLELNQSKKQLAELEANLSSTRQELGRLRCHLNQEEHSWHEREQGWTKWIEEGRCREKRLEDQKHNLEVCLADATQQMQELKARLGGAEGRVRALEDQLLNTEALKKELENKLSSIAHTLRRIAGVQFDGSVNLSYRLLSPSRRYSPVRGGCQHDYDNRSTSGGGDGPVDVDPELVRKGVRTLMHQVVQIEREKDDYKLQLSTTKKQLQDACSQQERSDSKMMKLQNVLRGLQEAKSTLESQLDSKISSLNALDEALKQKTNELIVLRDKLTSLEMQLGSGVEEKGQFEERLEKNRQHVTRLESEKRHLQEELARAEGRLSKLDLQRVALEGDITRLQMALTEKESAVRGLHERLENQGRSSAQLEDRCMSLKTTIDQLKERIQKAALMETELRGEINTLHKERSEQGHCIQAGQDKLKQLQKALSTCENEKRILSERLDAAQNNINELRRNQQAQQDSTQRLQEQVAELDVQKSAIESQLRIAKWNQENNDQINIGQSSDGDLSRQLMSSQREKSELKAKLDALKDKMKQLENERHSKFSGHVQFDRSEKSLCGDGGEMDSNRIETESGMSRRGHANIFNCGLDHSTIEHENRDLRIKVRRLETLLAEKETELARAKARFLESSKCPAGDADRYRNTQLQAEKLLDAREQAHRQQVLRLENQISMLREQLALESKRRQQYILRSSRANREMAQLRNTLGDSLRHVSQDPFDSVLLENETRRLDTAVSLSLPPSTCHDYDRSLSPHPRK